MWETHILDNYNSPFTKGIFKLELTKSFNGISQMKEGTTHTFQFQILTKSAIAE
jgi:hypothetical protein